jgi:hypothetical protein
MFFLIDKGRKSKYKKKENDHDDRKYNIPIDHVTLECGI